MEKEKENGKIVKRVSRRVSERVRDKEEKKKKEEEKEEEEKEEEEVKVSASRKRGRRGKREVGEREEEEGTHQNSEEEERGKLSGKPQRKRRRISDSFSLSLSSSSSLSPSLPHTPSPSPLSSSWSPSFSLQVPLLSSTASISPTLPPPSSPSSSSSSSAKSNIPLSSFFPVVSDPKSRSMKPSSSSSSSPTLSLSPLSLSRNSSLYASQLETLHALGFTDTVTNLLLLEEHKGDVRMLLRGQFAVEEEGEGERERREREKKRDREVESEKVEEEERGREGRRGRGSGGRGRGRGLLGIMDHFQLENERAESVTESTVVTHVMEKGHWREVDEGVFHYRYGNPKTQDPVGVVMFDMDGTLITTKSGKRFPTDRYDWRILFPSVIHTLRRLHAEGNYLAILTNQGGGAKDRAKLTPIKNKIEDLVKHLGVPMDILMAADYNQYRKPCGGFWDYVFREFLRSHEVEGRKVFVGDAAGRRRGWDGKQSTPADHSASDRKFAMNIGFEFQTPEEFFLNASPAPYFLGFNPADIPEGGGIDIVIPPFAEMVIFVGSPASGKSSLFRRVFQPCGYEHVNLDTLRTQDKCVKVAREALSSGRSVVIDNTNPSREARKRYLDVARSVGVTARCIILETSDSLSSHLNILRELKGRGKRVPEIAFRTFRSRYEAPSIGEGFKEVIRFPFAPSFASDRERDLFRKFTE